MLIKTNKYIPSRFDAYTVGPVILIRPASADDTALIKHEQTHVSQWFKATLLSGACLGAVAAVAINFGQAPMEAAALPALSVLTHGILYKVSKKYRYDCELEGHRVQYKHGGNLQALAVNFAQDYGFHISTERAKEVIRQ